MPDSNSVGGFAGGFLSSYADGILDHREREARREHNLLKTRMSVLANYAQNPDIQNDPKALGQLYQWMNELHSGQAFQKKGTSKKAASGQDDAHHTLVGHLLGSVGHALGGAGHVLSGNVEEKELKPIDLGEAPRTIPATAHELVPGSGAVVKTPELNIGGRGVLGALKTPEQRSIAARQTKAADVRADDQVTEEHDARVRALRETRLNKLHDAGTITDEEYREELIRIDDPTYKGLATGAGEARKRIDLVMPDGTRRQVDKGSRTGRYYDLNGGEAIADLPQGFKEEAPLKPSQDPMKIRERKAEFMALGYDDKAALQMAGWSLRREEDAMLARTQQQTQTSSQTYNMNSELSGVGGSRGPSEPAPFIGPGRPNPHYRGPVDGASSGSPSSTVTSGAAPSASRSVDSTRSKSPSAGLPGVTTQNVQTKPKAKTGPKSVFQDLPAPEGIISSKASGNKHVDINAVPAGGTEDQLRDLIDSDVQTSLAVKNLLGLSKGTRGTPAMQFALNAGMNKLKKITGIQDDQTLSAEVTERDGARKALNLGTQRLVAYDQGSGFVDAMAKAVQQAKSKFGNDPRFWQRVKNNINNNVVGDPDTDALVTAINGYQSAYSRVMSGGQMSTAQTHVAAQERAGKVIDAAMKGTEIDAVLKQVKFELDAERKAIIDNNGRARRIVAAPWGKIEEALKETSADPDKVQVQIPGAQPGWIHKSQLERFKKDHPNAEIIGAATKGKGL